MEPRADLTLFAHVARRSDDQLDLAQAALLVAEAEYADLDVARSIAALDELGSEARRRLSEVDTRGDAAPAVRRLLTFLYEEQRFVGNQADYYDPRNSFLNDVLERRTGIPITLAVVMIEVARRAGLTLHGVAFPGHFLVRAAGGRGPLFVDPFAGQVLDAAALRELNGRFTGQPGDPDPRLLEPIGAGAILMRMLANLRGIYADRHDVPRLRGVLERMHILAPSEELERQLAAVGAAPPSAPPVRRTLN